MSEVVMQIDYPYRVGGNGRTAEADSGGHLRDMIEQVLFTSPGERVNRPTFGCGLLQSAFGPNSPELAAATQFMVQSSLQEWLGDLIQVDEVDVVSEDSTLSVKVAYTVRRTRQRQQAQFRRAI